MPAHEWPLVGRGGQLEQVVGVFVGRSSALVVTGAAGVGKTRLVARARAEAGAAGIRIHWAVATASGAQVPFGPFAHLLPRRPLSVTEMLAATADQLARPGARDAVAVDDADRLDPASAALVAHLVANTSVPVVLTVRTGEALESLPWLRESPRLELGPLDAPQITDAVQTYLGGPVEAALDATLIRLSQGNPLLLRELVEAAVAGGAIARREGLWCAAGPIVAAGSLPGQVAARLGRLPADVLSAAELVAVAEPADAALLERVLSADQLAALERERLVSALGGPTSIGLAHPLYGEALRATTPPLRAREHRRRLADAVPVSGRDRIRAALWRLDAGLPVAADVLVDAARDASAALDHALAGRLAEAAVSASGSFEAELVLLGELPYQGRLAEALARAADLARRAADPRERATVARTRARLYLIAGDPVAARSTLDDAVATTSDPVLRRGLEMTRAAQAYTVGQVASCIALGDEVLAHHDDPETVARLAVTRVRALACAGRTADALELAERALGLVDTADPAGRALHATIDMTRLQALGQHGRTAEALAVGEAGMAAAAEGPAVVLRAFWAHELGQVQMLRGHPRTAVRWLRETLAVMPMEGVPASLQLWGLDGLAEAAALLGDAAGAARHEARLRAALPQGFQEPRRGGAAWAVAATGELTRARQVALAHADDLARVGAVTMACWSLHDAARLGGDSDVADRLAGLAGACQSPLLHAMAVNAAALASGNGDALDAVARTFVDMGCALFAAESASRAAALHRREGRRGAALASAALAQGAAAACEGARTPLLDTGGGHLEGLTDREREVVGLAARGRSDREIAEALHLSVRTVNSHLYRAYRKLGINDRSQLPSGLG